MWMSLSALAALRLPGWPKTAGGWQKLAREGRWQRAEWKWPANPDGRWRKRRGTGGGIEFHSDVLPERARKMLKSCIQNTLPPPETALEGAETTAEALPDSSADAAEALTDAAREAAALRLSACRAVDRLSSAGATMAEALAIAAAEANTTPATIRRWRARAEDDGDPLAGLADRRGRIARADAVDPAAWAAYLADYLRPAQPGHAACYRRLARAAQAHGWKIPSAATLKRKLEREVSAAAIVLARQGERALERLYPAQQRSRLDLGALEWVNADGHTFDVFVRFPDGRIGRPCLVAFQDVYSGAFLSWRLAESEHRDVVRLAFGGLVERYGIPEHLLLDNGRAFASKWLSGGTPTRYRFKVRPEDPIGLFTQVVGEIHWATPFHGQAKPIERGFRDLCEDIARAPFCAGAYTGNSPAAKPSDYGRRAIPWADFEAFVDREIVAHNTRPGRRSAVCAGRSLMAAFEASYSTRPIRKASAAQRRLWLLAAEGVMARADDGAVYIAGNRYWAEWIVKYRGQRLVARLDPAAMHAGIEVEQLDGRYLGFADCVAAVGFADQDAARAHASARRDYIRAVKAQLKAENKLTAADVAALIPAPAAPPPPAAGVVKPLFGGAERARRPAAMSDEEFGLGWTAAIERLKAGTDG
jgi:transposase InsO family protein